MASLFVDPYHETIESNEGGNGPQNNTSDTQPGIRAEPSVEQVAKQQSPDHLGGDGRSRGPGKGQTLLLRLFLHPLLRLAPPFALHQ